MSAGLHYYVCGSCGLAVFPPRALCPRCGASRWQRRIASEASVEETTLVGRLPGGIPEEPVCLATVRLDAGPAVVVRLHGAVGPGGRVRLETVGLAPHARAVG